MPEERARDINKVNLIFAISSIALAITVIWMAWDDYAREWKYWQRRFYSIDYAKTRREVQRIAQELQANPEYQQLERELKQARAEMAQRQKDLQAAQDRLKDLDKRLYKANQEFQFAKSRFSAARYEYEVLAARKDPDADEAQRELNRHIQEMNARERQLRQIEAEASKVQAEIGRITARISELERNLARITDTQERLKQKLRRIEPNFVNVYFRNAPLLDFMAPSIKINQIVLNNVYNDLNFMRIPRVDRCMTCHVPIDQRGYENFPQPFASHPRLDLFLDGKSPHPVDRFGCTVCHQGRDRGTTFYTAVHTPRDPQMAKSWEKKYDWHPFKHWDFPMLPLHYTEASCFKCHSQQVTIPRADQLNRGLLLFERSGCFGCHKTRGFENLRKVGPSLELIASKTTPEWTFKWIKDPKGFRPHTRMPKFFDLTNTSSPEDLVRNNVEAYAITQYLFKVSGKISYPKLNLRGDPSRGKQLVESIGCAACHYVQTPPKKPPIEDRRTFGPTLDKMGSKTNPEWLFNWLKNPRHYFPRTFMPNLRLTDQEAMDITAYLMSLRDPEFERKPLPEINKQVRDQIVLEFLTTTMIESQAKEKLASMSEEERNVFAGERLIARYGCYACHDIKGFEKAQPIGTELSFEGSKNIHQLDFGFMDIPHTRHDWFYQKLKDPRIFDMMPDMKTTKVKKPEEKLKMPNFQFTDEEIKALVTAILSFTKDDISQEIKRNLSPREVAIEEGRRLIRQYNCQGCHIIDGVGGDIRATIPDPGFHPPILDGQGARVKPEWMFGFLRNPTPIRPWLKVRMPTFGFTDTEINTIMRYFAFVANEEFPFKQYEYRFDPSMLAAGRTLFEKLQCLKCHVTGIVPPAVEASQLAPNLSMARERLKPEWIVKFLTDPQQILPGTAMPTFFPEGQSPVRDILGGDARKQIQALRDYILTLGPARPAPIARTILPRWVVSRSERSAQR